jgi:hypothetical protein
MRARDATGRGWGCECPRSIHERIVRVLLHEAARQVPSFVSPPCSSQRFDAK